jgi:hypothetical protein
MSTPPETRPEAPARTREASRSLDVLTAVLLGVVSLTTALGAWQADTWSRQADRYALWASDARDSNVTLSVDWQANLRIDSDAVQQARTFALREERAAAAGDAKAASYAQLMIGNWLGRSLNGQLPEAFAAWREAGFAADKLPTLDPDYVAELRGDADSYALVATVASELKDGLEAKASTLTQAAVVDALALFLLGVAGINRLRSARFATLLLGATAYVGSLFMMLGAY